MRTRGGGIVSSFECLKNLSHVKYGRLERRHQAAAHLRILGALEKLTEETLAADERSAIVRPVDELTVVNSGLEETMVDAYGQLREAVNGVDGSDNLRTAAFYAAIDRVARSYMDLGVFP